MQMAVVEVVVVVRTGGGREVQVVFVDYDEELDGGSGGMHHFRRSVAIRSNRTI